VNLSQVGNLERRFQPRDLADGIFEPALAEALVLLLLELLAELAIGAGSDDLAEGGKEHRVLARGVRPIHALEAAQSLGEHGLGTGLLLLALSAARGPCAADERKGPSKHFAEKPGARSQWV
jgi:hypothetical protein